MTLFSALRLLDEAFVKKNEEYGNLLAQNIYYIVPVVNPDGLALIEKDYAETKKILPKRKN